MLTAYSRMVIQRSPLSRCFGVYGTYWTGFTGDFLELAALQGADQIARAACGPKQLLSITAQSPCSVTILHGQPEEISVAAFCGGNSSRFTISKAPHGLGELVLQDIV